MLCVDVFSAMLMSAPRVVLGKPVLGLEFGEQLGCGWRLWVDKRMNAD